MCMSHGACIKIDNGYVETKPKKHIKKVSKNQFERGDPNFVDERKLEYEKPKKNKSLIESIFGS